MLEKIIKQPTPILLTILITGLAIVYLNVLSVKLLCDVIVDFKIITLVELVSIFILNVIHYKSLKSL